LPSFIAVSARKYNLKEVCGKGKVITFQVLAAVTMKDTILKNVTPRFFFWDIKRVVR
jgi:hypothetical protein